MLKKKKLFLMSAMLLCGMLTSWAGEVTYYPTLDVNFRTASGNTAWNSGFPKDAATEGNKDFELNYNAGIFSLQKYTVADLQNVTKLVLTLTVGSRSGVDAIDVWSLPNTTWTAATGVDDIVPALETVIGVAPRSSEGTANTPLAKGAKVANSSPAKATLTIQGTALTTLKANATSDGTFTLIVTNNNYTASSQRSYLSNNTANDEANRPTLVATVETPAVKNVTTGDTYSTLKDAFDAAVTAGTDAELEVYEDVTVPSRMTLNKAMTLTITPKANITIKATGTNYMWFLTNVNNATLNIGSSDYTITLDGQNKTYGIDVTKYENNAIIALTNVVFKDFDLNNAGHLVGSKAQEGQIILDKVAFRNCKNPANAFIDKQRVTNDRLVLKGYLNINTDCVGTAIYAVSETKSSGTTGRIKVDDSSFTASNPITINWPGTKAEGIVVVIGTSASNADKFQLADTDWTLERRSNGDLAMVAPLVPTAQIGSTTYANLTDALAAAVDGDEIELLDDQELTARVNIQNKAITIKGNHAITRASSYKGIMFLTVKPGEGEKNATLTLDGVTIDGQDVEATSPIAEASNGGTTILKNVIAKNCVNTNGAVLVNKSGGKLELNGVTFTDCSENQGTVFVGTSLTLKGENTIPSIYVEKQLVVNAADASVPDGFSIGLKTDANRQYGPIVKGDATQFSCDAFRLSQQGSDVYAMMLPVAASYSHPAMLHTASDIARVKSVLTQEPFASAYSALESASGGSAAGAVEWLKRMDKNNWESTYSDYTNFTRAANDAKLAYYLALRYQLKGSTAAANAAVAILNDWATNCKGFLRLDGYANNIPDPNEYLMTIQAYQFANAAELLRNYSGWQNSDFQKFQNWIRQTFADVAYLFLSGRDNLHYWLNWDLAALNALVSVGVLCDDQSLVDYALDYINNGGGTGNKANAIVATHSDPNSSETLAQCQESGRDQGHSTLDVTLMGVLCQTAQNAGIADLFSAYKALEMAEYVAKYNLKNDLGEYAYTEADVPFTTYNNGEETHTAISSAARGTVRPCYELFLAYAQQNDKAARYVELQSEWARRQNLFGEATSSSNDDLGFGTLMYMSADANDYANALTVGAAGMATLVLPFEAIVPEGVKIYTVSYTSGDAAQATEIETGILPANTPVLVTAEAGQYAFTANTIWQSGTPVKNALTGVYAKTIVPAGSYILTQKDGIVAFRKADGTTNTVEANRCFLTAESAGARLLIAFDDDNVTTGIESMNNVQVTMDNEVYDLQGCRVESSMLKKGLYIVNGKKVVIK